MRFVFYAAALLGLVPGAAGAGDPADGPGDQEAAPYVISGTGFITDGTHPLHPGHFTTLDVDVRLQFDPEKGETVIEIDTGAEDARDVDRYFVRRGRIFQVDKDGTEIPAEALGDVSPATVAALHPVLVADAIFERRENLRASGGPDSLFAWNDELWSVSGDGLAGDGQSGGSLAGRITRLSRRVYDPIFGDGSEDVIYTEGPASGGLRPPARVVVRSGERELAGIDFGAATAGLPLDMPAGGRRRDRAEVVAERDLVLGEVAPHLFTLDLVLVNTRVMVAEFTDQLVVLEGAFNSRICDRIARLLHERLRKPVRYFAFSHLHGQYVGGTRSWVHEGATVVVPPTTAPLITRIVAARHDLEPDALSREPRPLRLETVPDTWRLEDSMNALEIHNVPSGHTDEYFIFYFPRPKILMTGDLLFYRPGKPLAGRSRQLCDTVADRGLDVAAYYCTWPLAGMGTKNVVTREEMREACAMSK